MELQTVDMPMTRCIADGWIGPFRKSHVTLLRRWCLPVPQTFGYEPIPFREGVDWRKYNGERSSFLWWFNTLNGIRPLLDARARAQADIEIAAFLARNWAEANPLSHPASERAWDGHAAANRSETLACLWQLGVRDQWLKESLQLHADFLLRPENYQGSWNHGLDQNVGLASIGLALGEGDLIAAARKRSSQALHEMIDEQGVASEQAVAYHSYVYVRADAIRELFKQCGYPLASDIDRRLALMPEFQAHATAPDGCYEQIGDTYHVKPASIEGTEAEYAVTDGKSGRRPARTVAVYDAGYVFGRTGWGECRHPGSESFYSVRFGVGRRIHGHNDHMSLTYHPGGKRVIVDSGFHGYTDDAWRAYFRSAPAHNVAYALGNDDFRSDVETSLDYSIVTRTWQSYGMRDNPYAETERRRDVLFLQEPFEAIVVVDRIDSTRAREYEQAWHFDPSLSADGGHGRVAVREGDQQVLVVQQLWPYDSLSIENGQDVPRRGWSARQQFQRVAAPVMLTRRKGTAVTFLTLITRGDVGISQKRQPAHGPVSRTLTITREGQSCTLHLTREGRLVLYSSI